MKHIALLLALLMVATSADAAMSVILKADIRGGDVNETQMVLTPVEDCSISHNIADMAPRDSNSSGFVVGPEKMWGDNGHYTSLLGVMDLFNQLPASTIAAPEDIKSATLTIRQGGPMGGEIIGVRKVTSPWMLYAEADDDVTALHRVPGGEDPWWAADLGKLPTTDASGNLDYSAFVGFTAADYDPASGSQFTITETASRTAYEIDILQMVRDWYVGGDISNQGIALVWEYQGTWPHDGAPYFRRANYNPASWDLLPDGSHAGPEFAIVYAPEPVTIGLLAVGGLALLRRKR